MAAECWNEGAATFRSWILPLAALLCLVVSMIANPTRADAAPAKCADVTFIGARGSGEEDLASTKGMGPSVYFMAKQMKGRLHDRAKTMEYRRVDYPATSTKKLIPSSGEFQILRRYGLAAALALYYARHARPYLASIHTGVIRTIKAIKRVNAKCPRGEIVLGGYSQGAMAIHQAELQLVEEGNDGAMRSIGGTLLLGDGDRVPSTEAVLIGGAAPSGAGIQARLHAGWLHPADVAEPHTTVEICAPHDIVCDFSATAAVYAGRDALLHRDGIHTGYVDHRRTLLRNAVNFVAHMVG
jgi:cutinase